MSSAQSTQADNEVRLSSGTIRYRDDGEGLPIVFVHGIGVNGALWSGAAARLRDDFRCIAPDWPLGSHRVPMSAGADLTPPGVADLVAEFIERLDLGPVTLVGNDSGGAIAQLVATRHADRVERLVLTNCDAFDRFPPPMFVYLRWSAFVPGAVSVLAQSMRFHWVRRLPMGFGWLTHEPMSDELLETFVRPGIEDRLIRRDIRKMLKAISPRYTRAAAERLPEFRKPALIAWGLDDKFFPGEYARKLAATLPDARLEWIEGACTLVPQDQPDRLAELIDKFMRS